MVFKFRSYWKNHQIIAWNYQNCRYFLKLWYYLRKCLITKNTKYKPKCLAFNKKLSDNQKQNQWLPSMRTFFVKMVKGLYYGPPSVWIWVLCADCHRWKSQFFYWICHGIQNCDRWTFIPNWKKSCTFFSKLVNK